MAEQKKAAEQAPWEGGELLYAGGTDFFAVGRHATLRTKKKSEKEQEEEMARIDMYPNLPEPHRLKPFADVKIKFIAAGAAAAHALCTDMEDRLYAWGRNEKGQLGLGDRKQRNMPCIVPGLEGIPIVHGACGKCHTVVVAKDGKSYAWGFNAMGQCGTVDVKLWIPKRGKDKPVEEVLEPTVCLVNDATKVACGADFTMWICAGKLWAAGNPEFGQLGDGEDHGINVKDSSIKIMHEPQGIPSPVPRIPGTVNNVACGPHHTVCITKEGACYSWGSGGYGRLGHKVQQDEFSPRQLDTLQGRLACPPNAVCAAGGTASFADATAAKMLYAWGKMKASGDSQMYPQPFMDMSGWNVRSMACGPGTYAIAAEKSAVTWGAAHNGELAYGADGKKSSANPAQVMALEGMHTHQVACGIGFTMFLVTANEAQKARFPVWDVEVIDPLDVTIVDEEGDGKGGTKRKAPPAAPKAKKAK